MCNLLANCGSLWGEDRVGELFEGATELTLDSKGRLAVPTRYREHLIQRCGGRLVITVDTVQRCLAVYPLTEWELIRPSLDKLSSLNKKTAIVKRVLLGNASEVEMDKSGRVLIPTKLRKHAALEKKIVMIGLGKKFELWDEQTWDDSVAAWQSEGILDSEDLPDELESLEL